MATLGVIIGALVNAAIIAVLARRLLGVPVGWPRTLVLSVAANAAAGPLLVWSLHRLGIPGDYADTSHRAGLVLLSVLFVAWVVALEVGLLAILEAVLPTGSVPGPVEWLRSLPARWRRGRRYLQILRIAARHGLGRYATPRRDPGEASAVTTATALRRALTDGGVTFVKLGQMLSTRSDLIGPEYVAQLSLLQADVPPQPWEEVAATLQAELGETTALAHIDPQPMAAASVGQVHRARLATGEDVVVKVQRSDARRQVTADLDIVLRLARWLQRTAPWARSLGVLGLAEGFAASLEEELDYRVEAANMTSVRQSLPADSPVAVPRVHEELCTRRVLVMEAMTGRTLSSAASTLAELSQQRRDELAQDLLGVVLRQVLQSGVFHADLHAGNVLIDDDARLSLLDFGSVGRLDRGARTSLGLLLLAVDRQDAVGATQALCDLLDRNDRIDDRALERDLGQLIMRFGGAIGQATELFVHLLRLVLRHGLSIPPPVAAAFRALGALEGTLMLLSPRLDLIAAARSQGRAAVGVSLDPGALRAELTEQLAGMLPIIQRLPRRIASIAEDLDNGEFRVVVRTLQDPAERGFLTNLVQQVVMAMLTATAAVCGMLLVLWGGGPELAGDMKLSTYLGLVLLLFGFVLGSRIVVLVFRNSYSGQRSRAG